MSTTISLPERFDFGYHKQFSELMKSTLGSQDKDTILLDFSLVQYLDSAALGMIVMFYKRAKEKGRVLEVINATGTAREILKIANFEKLMTIH